ncbi:MAG: hypothetical protein ACKVVP_04905 [Chloroflexota bacterium]
MAKEITPIDITNTPELVRLAEEVARNGTARVLRRDDEKLAVLSPIPAAPPRRHHRVKIEADLRAFRALQVVGAISTSISLSRTLMRAAVSFAHPRTYELPA